MKHGAGEVEALPSIPLRRELLLWPDGNWRGGWAHPWVLSVVLIPKAVGCLVVGVGPGFRGGEKNERKVPKPLHIETRLPPSSTLEKWYYNAILRKRSLRA